ncbi:MAG: GGDEF domain-containing protein [Burkholderiales bacterium PBB3]|nr:MAG: GGDEF domain-containing protein [Burkholderiales bacterium PBB3]
MSLRLKFVLALLFSSIASVALVGGVAYVQLTDKFDSLRRQQASLHFIASVTDYLTRYGGSWQAASAVMPFRQFMEQQGSGNGQQKPQQRPPRPDGPPDQSRGPSPGDDRRPAPDGRPAGPDGRPPGPPDAGPEGGPRRNDAPPFRFILLDSQYRVLLGAGDYAHDVVAPPEIQRDATPIVINGKVEAYVAPQGVLAPGKQDIEYLAAMREALGYGAAAAAVLALGLGLLLGNGLSATLRQLTRAVKAMRGGALRQKVPVEGGGEIATLATAFNQMSEELAQSHEALQLSNQTILEQASQLKEMSIRDALTDLYNRRHFDEQAQQLFEQSVRHGHPMTVVMGDIDFFKRINDTYSHATGDVVLKQIAEILRTHMRISDVVARYGGEEFVIILPETPLPQAAALCDKLRQVIEGFPWTNVHPDLRVTMSMGLCADVAAGTVHAMLDKADGLLYRAKEMGRNRVCFA